jgi:hypothetical protein
MWTERQKKESVSHYELIYTLCEKNSETRYKTTVKHKNIYAAFSYLHLYAYVL